MAWIGEARVPAGDGDDSGEWTDDPSGSVVDVAADGTSRNLCATQYAVDFVKKYIDEATTASADYGVSGEYVLGLAARESGYGKGPFMRNESNAFFNLQKEIQDGESPTNDEIHNMPYATGMIPAKEANRKTHKRAWVYTYNSFSDATKSLLDVYGQKVRAASSSKDFLLKLKQAGFNPHPNFLNTTVLDQAAARLRCPG